jgi:7-cyano-7-deazaguanine synthase
MLLGDIMNKKAIVLLSGGIDSAVCYRINKACGYDCYPLFFRTSETKKHEYDCANFQVEESLKSLFVILGNPVPDSNFSEVTPGRNMLFLSYAFAYAETIKADIISIGAINEDHLDFPDCRPEFFNAMVNIMVSTSIWNPQKQYEINRPLINKTKAEVIKLGIEFNVNFNRTTSCYQLNIKEEACGICFSCRERLAGFKLLGEKDPIKYVAVPPQDTEVKN